jgi:hypothetical protein
MLLSPLWKALMMQNMLMPKPECRQNLVAKVRAMNISMTMVVTKPMNA